MPYPVFSQVLKYCKTIIIIFQSMQRKKKKLKIDEMKTEKLDNFNDNNNGHIVSHFLEIFAYHMIKIKIMKNAFWEFERLERINILGGQNTESKTVQTLNT